MTNYKSVGFIGNSKSGNEPFGTFSDLRIYPYILKTSQITAYSKYHDELGKSREFTKVNFVYRV